MFLGFRFIFKRSAAKKVKSETAKYPKETLNLFSSDRFCETRNKHVVLVGVQAHNFRPRYRWKMEHMFLFVGLGSETLEKISLHHTINWAYVADLLKRFVFFTCNAEKLMLRLVCDQTLVLQIRYFFMVLDVWNICDSAWLKTIKTQGGSLRLEIYF